MLIMSGSRSWHAVKVVCRQTVTAVKKCIVHLELPYDCRSNRPDHRNTNFYKLALACTRLARRKVLRFDEIVPRDCQPDKHAIKVRFQDFSYIAPYSTGKKCICPGRHRPEVCRRTLAWSVPGPRIADLPSNKVRVGSAFSLSNGFRSRCRYTSPAVIYLPLNI